MLFSVESHGDARLDLVTNAAGYEELAFGLGRRFIAAVEHVVFRIQPFSHLYPVVADVFRRADVNRFPFGVVM